MKKKYLLDTNILMASSKSIYRFKDNEIYICDTTLEELDGLKSDKGEKGYYAREAIKEIDVIRKKGDLSKGGIRTPDGGLFQVVITSDCENILPAGWSLERNDDKIINAAKTKKAILVTNDISMQIKADVAGVKTESYKNEQVSEDSIKYTGRISIKINDDIIDKFYGRRKTDINLSLIPDSERHNLIENQYITAIGKVNPKKSFIARVSKGKLITIDDNQNACDVVPRNSGQKFALDALLAPASEIPLVILKGPAGTAKTFLALAAGLQKVMNEEEYRKILIFRPNVKFDDDIGYLKGDEMDKIMPLMRPCIDNLEVLLSNKKDNKETIKGKIDYLFAKGIVDAEAMAYLRGRSINNSWVIFDEAQNATPNQIFGAITRAGINTKIVIVGDPEQIDNPKLNRTNNGLVYAAEKMLGSELCAQLTFDKTECVRSDLAAQAAERMK